MKNSFALGVVTAVMLSSAPVFGIPLNVVTTNAPAVNCVFDLSCTIIVSDTTAPIPIAIQGPSFLQARTFTGNQGAPANGLYGYEFRIDLTNAVSAAMNPPCIRSLTVNLGSVVGTLDYNNDGIAMDHVYVVTQGGLGNVGLLSADRDIAGNVTFTFNPSVCPGTNQMPGQTSYFFGLASKQPPAGITATVTEVNNTPHQLAARAPSAGPACSVPPYLPAFWNDGGQVQGNNNCYNYGNNTRTDTYAQPGRAAGQWGQNTSCPSVIASATADGLVPTTANAVCPNGMDKVAVVVAPGVDYHWYRQGLDGMWTHKPGGGQATNIDNSNKQIANPETADRCYVQEGLCYNTFCGYFCTCSDEQQWQGHAKIN